MGIFDTLLGRRTEEMSQQRTWLDYKHPEYLMGMEKWFWAMAHYEGSVIDEGQRESFLIRKLQAETQQAFIERASLADYTPHFASAVDSLVGMLFQVEEDAIRKFGTEDQPGLGDPDDSESEFFPIWQNADGTGTGWPTVWKQFALDLVLTRKAWMVVSPDANGRPRLVPWASRNVPNWVGSGTNMTSVLIKHVSDERADLHSAAASEGRWTEYTMDGWQTWKKNERTQMPEAVTPFNKYVIPLEDVEGNRVLPVYCINLPVKRDVGYIMARKANAIFNKESELDNLLRTAHFPYLVIPGGDTFFDKVISKLAVGLRALQSDPQSRDPSFIAPSHEGATVQDERLRRKVEEFYITFFRQYGDSAREKTATEVRQDVNAGVGAFLQLLKAGVDDGENQAMFRVAQYLMPNNPERWFVNTIERSDNFGPIDVIAMATSLTVRYFGTTETVPVGLTGLMNIAKTIASYDGIEVNDDELKAAVATQQLNKLAALFAQLPIPASIRAKMTLQMIESMGYLEPDAPETDDPEDVAEKALLAEMNTLAQQEDESKRLAAQPLFQQAM